MSFQVLVEKMGPPAVDDDKSFSSSGDLLRMLNLDIIFFQYFLFANFILGAYNLEFSPVLLPSFSFPFLVI